MRWRSLLALLVATVAHAGTSQRGFPIAISAPAGMCNNATAAAGPLWSIYATDPVPTCPTATALKRGTLNFDDTNTCTANNTTIGCATYGPIVLPAEFASGGHIDARIIFTTTDTTAGDTTIWTVATKCITPSPSRANGNTSDPGTTNASQSVTYVTGPSDASGSLRYAQLFNVTTIGCLGGDLLYVRFGRDTTDTNVDASLALVAAEVVIYGNP